MADDEKMLRTLAVRSLSRGKSAAARRIDRCAFYLATGLILFLFFYKKTFRFFPSLLSTLLITAGVGTLHVLWHRFRVGLRMETMRERLEREGRIERLRQMSESEAIALLRPFLLRDEPDAGLRFFKTMPGVPVSAERCAEGCPYRDRTYLVSLDGFSLGPEQTAYLSENGACPLPLDKKLSEIAASLEPLSDEERTRLLLRKTADRRPRPRVSPLLLPENAARFAKGGAVLIALSFFVTVPRYYRWMGLFCLALAALCRFREQWKKPFTAR